MRLHQLPRDALDNVLSHLSMPDIFSLARASRPLTAALSPFLRRSHVVLDPTSRHHLLAPNSRIGLHIRHLVVSVALSPADLSRLGRVCCNLLAVSFQNIDRSLCSRALFCFLRAVGPSLRSFSAEFCAALSGPVLLPALAALCPALLYLRLCFIPRVYATHLQLLLLRVGSRLRVLDLDSCAGVDDAVVIAAAKHCPCLQDLSVGVAEEVSDRAVLALSNAPCAKTLRRLDIRGCMNITDDGLFAIATSCSNLVYLNVWRVCLTSYAIRAVAEGLGEHLETLIMGDCIGIDDTALQSIADNCNTLVNLEMAGLKRVTDTGVTALFDENRTGKLRLETLTIDGCQRVSEATMLAAAGLWDGRWAVTASPEVSTELLREKSWWAAEGCSSNDQRLPEGRKVGEFNEVHRSEFVQNVGILADKMPVLPPHTGRTESGGSPFFQSEKFLNGYCDMQDLETFERSSNVSYLRKLSAIGTKKIRQQFWNHIRRRRPDMDFRVEISVSGTDESLSSPSERRRFDAANVRNWDSSDNDISREKCAEGCEKIVGGCDDKRYTMDSRCEISRRGGSGASELRLEEMEAMC